MIKAADIINLHWVAQYQSPLTLRRLFSMNKPVVWTLHDQWAFTGGCHYSAGCERYRTDCMECPQLDDDFFNLPAAVLRDKEGVFEDADLTIITPSRWMAECAERSRLFSRLRIETIPNSLESDLFTPLPKTDAKTRMGIESDTVTLLFGGEDGNEKRKGFKELIAAIQYCMKDGEFQDLFKSGKIRLNCFGHPNDELESLGILVGPLGYLDSDEKIRDAYASADVFILPSLEDNLPNTILEAMSCGTPVVAFDTGGIPEMVTNGVTGKVVPLGEAEKMGEALLSLIFNADKREAMGQKCRDRIEEEYSLNVQALRYEALYEELLKDVKPSAQSKPSVTTTGEGEDGQGIGSEMASVPFDPRTGPHVSAIYDKILLKALKEFAPYAHERWQTSEADRLARLKVIQDQGEDVMKLESEVDHWLEESKRLQKVIQEQGERIQEQGERIQEQGERIQEQAAVIQEQGEKIVKLERENNELHDQIELIENSLVWRLRTFVFNNLIKEKRPRMQQASMGKARGELTGKSLVSFKKGIDSFNRSQLNMDLLNSIRAFNHNMIDQFNDICPLKGCLLLDIGASPHGYADERALEHGVSFYAGIGLDITGPEYVLGDKNNAGILLNMDAVSLKFPDAIFDAVFSVNAFEHISHVDSALAEINRVLKPGGRALISFEPVWSCSYGHHLHHFALDSDLIPPWSHLIWSPERMRESLSPKWPADAPLTLDQAIEWIYSGDSINRLNIRDFLNLFHNGPLKIDWKVYLREEKDALDLATIEQRSAVSGLNQDELTTKGLSLLLIKE